MVAEGYMKTEVGVIPEDWSISSIGSVCQIFGRIGFRGYTVNDIVTSEQGAITISPSNIQDNKTIFDKCTYISWYKYEESPEIKIYNNDILVVKTGSTVGKTALVKNLLEKATINPQIVVLKNIKIDNVFLGYVASSKLFQNQILKTVVGGAIPTLSQKQIANFIFPNPPKQEQKLIATALSDVDRLIASLESLIKKKENIKTATMQQLLTGKKRLDGFSGEWVEKKLGDIVGSISSGKSNTKSIGTQYPIYGSTGIIGYRPSFDYTGNKLLVARVGANAGTVNKVSGNYCVSDNTIMITFNADFDFNFAYYLLIKQNLSSLVFGSGQPLITGGHLKELIVLIPPQKEQVAIATVLLDGDKELEALKTRLEKTKAIKIGMMQELLTGKTRLINKGIGEKNA